MVNNPSYDNHSICSECKHEIDPETCWCGDYVKNHGFSNGHSAVPMGCVCYYATKPEAKKEIKINDK